MDDVPEYLAAADLHVFSSFADVWGLTVNEAMHCGVPTLCSVHAGCTDDLVDETVGFRFDPGSSEDFDRALQTALRSEHLAELGEAAERRGRLYTTDRLAQAFRDSVARARSAGRHSLASA